MPSFILQSVTLLPAVWHLAHWQQALSDADFSLSRYGGALCPQLPLPSLANSSAAGGLAQLSEGAGPGKEQSRRGPLNTGSLPYKRRNTPAMQRALSS